MTQARYQVREIQISYDASKGRGLAKSSFGLQKYYMMHHVGEGES